MRNSVEVMQTKEEVEQLLLTVLLPSFPPNRSQWKKLEIALDFIKKSRTQTRARAESVESGRRGSVSSDLQELPDSALYNYQKTEFPQRVPGTIFVNNTTPAIPPQEITSKHKMLLQKPISWSKLKRSLQKMM